MKKTVITLFALGLTAALATSAFAANAVRISQVYSGGGGSSGTYNHDYIELFNSSGSVVSLNGWSLEYGSATGSSFGSTTGNQFVFPAGAVIQPCSYLLIETGSAGSAGTALPIPADYTYYTGLNLSGSTGKLALVNNTNLNNICGTAGVFVDLVGWSTANCYETANAAAPPGTTYTLIRANGGMTDTDNNSADLAWFANPVTMHNAASGANASCQATPTSPRTWGSIKTLYR